MKISEFQRLIESVYLERDSERGVPRTFAWFVEEVGELAKALHRPERVDENNLREEFADVLAWLTTLASLSGVELEDAAREKYAAGCPKCGGTPCSC